MKKRRPLVGVVIKDADHDFWGRSLSWLQKEFFAADMDVAIFSAFQIKKENWESEHAIFGLMKQEHLDGLVVYVDRFEQDGETNAISEEVLAKMQKPVVFIRDGQEEENTFTFDNTEGADALIGHLALEHQVKRTALVSGPEESSFHQAIRSSFFAAMEKYGVEHEGRIYYTNDWAFDFNPIAEELISCGLPDAIVCCGEMTASSLIRELSCRGVKIPRDVIVTGYRYNEPREVNHYNITSVLRKPEMMSVNAARKLIGMIRGQEWEPVSLPTCELLPGFSCGCREVDLVALSNSAYEDLLAYRSEDFQSRFSYMQDELIACRDMEEYFWKLDEYARRLGDVKGLWVCLNHNVLHSETSGCDYTEEMDLCFARKGEEASIDFHRVFHRNTMLPELFANRDKPTAFFFNPFHYGGVNFGYLVLSYGSSGAVYDENYVRWLRYAAGGLENKRQHLLFQDAEENMRTRDPLTGLYNMRGYQTHMQHLWTVHQDQGYLLRIIALSIENLSGIRDAYGFQAADNLLQKFASLLLGSVGMDDICVRLSGEVFLIVGLMDAVSPVDDVPVRLQQNLEEFNEHGGGGHGISICSASLAAAFDNMDIIDSLPQEVDFQRKLNKENNRVNYARHQAEAVSEEHVDREERDYVAHMLDENLFTYHFQPIVETSTGAIIAYEALMRSGTDRPVTPYAILQHAKALGRLREVERLTITNLLSYLRTHTSYFRKKKLFINSIPSCILSSEEFAAIKEQYGDLMDQVTIEFTEQSEASADQLKTLLNLRDDMGFYLAIDDYGTGYSNISNLLTLMPNYIKIDRSLISNIHEDRRKQHFAQNIIEYAHDNDFKVLAEGVEQLEELRMVIRMGVDLIQGYYTGRPAAKPISAIEEEIVSEICETYRSSQNKQIRKVFYSGSEKEMLLHTLDFNEYTELFISSSEYTVRGKDNFSSSVMIRIKEDTTCRLVLDNVSLRGNAGPVCIEIGENSKVEICIQGDVNLTGAIRVPATAELKLVGDGRLSLFSATGQTFGIGNDLDQSYGNISFRMSQRVFFQLDTQRCVAIGGGRNDNHSRILIDGCQVDVNLAGRHVVGVGCIEGKAMISLRSCGLSILHNCRTCVALGGGESYQLSVQEANLKLECHGDSVAGIYSAGDRDCSLIARNSTIGVLMRGKQVHGIGTEKAFMNFFIQQCDLDINCNGVETYAFGNANQQGVMNLSDCKGSITVETRNGKAIAMDDANVSFDRCQLTIR